MQQKLTQASKEAEAKSNPEGVVKKKKKDGDMERVSCSELSREV